MASLKAGLTLTHDAAFAAQVALEAYAQPQNIQLIADRYDIAVSVVAQWREHLASTAEGLFTPVLPDPAPSEVRQAGYSAMDAGLAALEDMDVCIAVLEGLELRYRFANPAYCANAPSPDIIGRRMREVFPLSMTDGVESGILNVLPTGEPWEVKNYKATVPGQGDSVWEGKITRLPLASGMPPAVAVWIRDVTSSARIETSLREQVALLRAISDNSTDVMFAKDRQGRLQFANPAALELIGKSHDEVIGKTDADLLQDKQAAAHVRRNDLRIMEAGCAEEVEEIVPLPDGTHRLWLSQKRPYHDAAGRVIGLLGVSRDITDRKIAEESVRSAHGSLQRVLDSITDGLAVFDRDWKYTYFSETGAKMLGVRSEDLLGKCVWDLFPHAEDLLFGREYKLAMEEGVARHFEDFYPAPLSRWIECHCYPSADGLSVYFRDVTDRRKAQDAAAENERRVNALLEATPVGLAYVAADGRVLVMNGEGKRIWGNPPQPDNTAEYAEWKGWWADQSEKHGQALGPHDWPTARALRGEHVIDTAIEIEPFDMPGSRRLILHRSVPIPGHSGEIAGAVTALMDITEFAQTKRAVVESNHRMLQLANTIPQLAWMADRDGAVHWYNDRWLDYTGLHESDMTGWGWESLHDRATLPTVLEKWRHSLRHGTAFEMTFPLRGKDGNYRPFYTLAEPLKDLEGEVVQWFGTCTDVSALQLVQTDLTKTQQWLQEGLVTGSMVAWEWEFDIGDIRYSDNAEHVLGYTHGDLSAALLTIHEEDRETYRAAVDRAINDGSTIDVTTRRIRPDNGGMIWIRTKGNPLFAADGKPHGFRGILIDVTEQIQREQSLEDANNRKDEFLAMLAHELRNPLAPIATASQLLMMSGVDAQRVKTSSEIIARQIGHMTRLIDDLLDVSRVTRGLVELDTQPVQIKDVINSAIEQARPLIELRKHELTLRVDSTPAMVLGDRVRLCQIVVNLLNNAAKYTPQGGKIDLDIRVEGAEVHIVISDNGIGIDSELLPRVFELFTQATRTPDRTQGGLGLGLALVDSLARMQGGRVSAHSDGQGHGSRFVVVLPLFKDVATTAGLDGQAISRSTPAGAETLSIMVVDDNTDAADMLVAILRLQGHLVRVEYSSTAALHTARNNQSDLYVLDIGLPDLDGYGLVKALRSMPINADAVFVALTGYGQAHDKTLSKSAGFDHHLVKPVDIVHLDSIVRSIARQRP